jgi:hypothetical protein
MHQRPGPSVENSAAMENTPNSTTLLPVVM